MEELVNPSGGLLPQILQCEGRRDTALQLPHRPTGVINDSGRQAAAGYQRENTSSLRAGNNPKGSFRARAERLKKPDYFVLAETSQPSQTYCMA